MKIWTSVFSEALIPADAALSKYDDAAFSSATKSGEWLPRLQLMTSSAEKCKRAEFPTNHYALVDGSNFIDIGTTVDVLVITWRPKAIEMGDEVITVYDPSNPEFARIQELSDVKDSGCMFGVEFLLWVASQGRFATFFMGSKSARRESANVKALMKKAATLKSSLIETKKYSWQSPCVSPCSTPFDPPNLDALMVEVKKFNNPESVDVKTATPDEAAATSRER